MDPAESVLKSSVGSLVSLTRTTRPTSKAKQQSDSSAGTHTRRSDQAFRFLDLPAELRNQVYEYYIIEHRTSTWRRPLFRRRYRTLRLSQVCKQIRLECRSMCLAKNEWIRLGDFDNYFAAFHSGSDSVTTDNITVDMFEISTKKAAEVDLIPLFERLCNLPNVVCAFSNTYTLIRGSSLNDLGPILTRCAKLVCTDKWSLASTIVVSIIPRWANKKVVVNVGDHFKYKGEARRIFETELLIDLGLRSQGRWGVLIKYVSK